MQDILTGNRILQLPGKRDSLKFISTECGFLACMMGIRETIRLSKRESKYKLINQAHVTVGCFQTKL